MPSDYSFIANNPQGNPVNQMGGLVNIANGIQNFQSNNIELQKSRQLNQDRQALQEFTSNPDNWQTDGKIDMDKINKAVPQIAPLAGPDYIAICRGAPRMPMWSPRPWGSSRMRGMDTMTTRRMSAGWRLCGVVLFASSYPRPGLMMCSGYRVAREFAKVIAPNAGGARRTDFGQACYLSNTLSILRSGTIQIAATRT